MPAYTQAIAALTNAESGAVDNSRTYYFQTVNGIVLPSEEVTEILAVPGLNGHGVRHLGRQAPESQLVTLEFVESFAAGTQKLKLYKRLIKEATLGVAIYQSGVAYYPADVLSVNYAAPMQATYAPAVVGSLVANPNVILECAWVVKLRDE